jgi:hypothetical protein
MLDRIPAALRHYLIGLAAVAAAAGLTFVADNYASWTLPAAVQAVGAALVPLIPVAVLALTTLSRQYGVGTGDPAPAAAVAALPDVSALAVDAAPTVPIEIPVETVTDPTPVEPPASV